MQDEKRVLAISENLNVEIDVKIFGSDIGIFIMGGEAHIGAVSVIHNGAVFNTNIPGHKEFEINGLISEKIKKANTTQTVSIICGIHIDDISKAEIAKVIEECDKWSTTFCGQLKEQR